MSFDQPDSIMRGLNEALAVANGKDVGAKTHHVEVRAIDIAAIRMQTGLSQDQFALSIGVAKDTLLNWERGRRRPRGPARTLLTMIEKTPSLVADLLP